MSKEKYFGDLKVGDIIFIADLRKWTLNPVKVIDIKPAAFHNEIWIYLESKSNFHVNKTKNYYGGLLGGCWVNRENAVKAMLKISKERENIYIREIDSLVSEYDSMIKFTKENGQKV